MLAAGDVDAAGSRYASAQNTQILGKRIEFDTKSDKDLWLAV
jgi:hypothetical protein